MYFSITVHLHLSIVTFLSPKVSKKDNYKFLQANRQFSENAAFHVNKKPNYSRYIYKYLTFKKEFQTKKKKLNFQYEETQTEVKTTVVFKICLDFNATETTQN